MITTTNKVKKKSKMLGMPTTREEFEYKIKTGMTVDQRELIDKLEYVLDYPHWEWANKKKLDKDKASKTIDLLLEKLKTRIKGAWDVLGYEEEERKDLNNTSTLVLINTYHNLQKQGEYMEMAV